MKAQKRSEPRTSFGKFEEFVKKIAAVPKEELDKKRAEHERDKGERKRAG